MGDGDDGGMFRHAGIIAFGTRDLTAPSDRDYVLTRDDRHPLKGSTQIILRHWREAVPNDRLAHLVRDAAKGLTRALQMRLAEHATGFGHWAFLRILWEKDGLTQRELSEQAGVMEPTTFSALKAMEKRKYITRKRYADDRKKVFVFLTPRGRALKE